MHAEEASTSLPPSEEDTILDSMEGKGTEAGRPAPAGTERELTVEDEVAERSSTTDAFPGGADKMHSTSPAGSAEETAAAEGAIVCVSGDDCSGQRTSTTVRPDKHSSIGSTDCGPEAPKRSPSSVSDDKREGESEDFPKRLKRLTRGWTGSAAESSLSDDDKTCPEPLTLRTDLPEAFKEVPFGENADGLESSTIS